MTTTFDDLFAREYARVTAIARRIVGDAAEAEDVAQEVFVSFARLRGPSDPGAGGWLRTAAVHVALNHVRSRRRRLHRELADFRLRRSLREGEPADPQRALDRDEQRLLVRAAMARLSTRDAELLALRYSGLSYREIAHALSLDVNQIGTRLARAERAFRKEIERETS